VWKRAEAGTGTKGAEVSATVRILSKEIEDERNRNVERLSEPVEF